MRTTRDNLFILRFFFETLATQRKRGGSLGKQRRNFQPGELNAIKAVLPVNGSISTPHYFDYLSFSYYDGLGQKRALAYGNDVVTDFAYEPNSRLMQTVTLTTPKGSNGPATLMNKEIDYFANGNIKKISNDLTDISNAYTGMHIGFDYSHEYSYDYANRLSHTVSSLQTQAGATPMAFSLDMTYDEVGRILTKNQISGYNADQTYQYSYGYNSNKPHQIDQVVDGNNVNDFYQYTARGGIEAIKPQNVLMEGFLWDPEDRLRAVKNNRQINEDNDAFFDIHHYIYDPNGTRLMKASLKHDYTAENGQQLGATQHVLDPYTVYVSGNYVVKFYDEYADVSKHYYAGGQRIASKLWQWQYNPTANPSQDPITPVHPPAVQNNIVLEDLWDVISLWDSVLGTETPTLQELQHMQLPTRAPYQTELCAHYTEDALGYPNELQQGMTTLDHINCLCRNGENAYVWQNYGVSCHNFEELYFYHPDYLSNTEYVTDAGGYVYQYLFYSPFGESLYAQHAQTGEYNTPHRFNAKELDPETGNYYYGARYYNPRVSVWLSVDPMAAKGPNITPYAFTHNNPIILVDPDGRWPAPIITGLIGGAIGGGIELASQVYSNVKENGFSVDAIKSLDGRKILGAAAEGAITGAVVGLTGGASIGIFNATISQAAAGTLGGVVKRAINHESLFDKNAMRADFISGGLGGLVGNVIGKKLAGTTATTVLANRIIKKVPAIARGISKFLGRKGSDFFNEDSSSEYMSGGWVLESQIDSEGRVRDNGIVRVLEPLPEVVVE